MSSSFFVFLPSNTPINETAHATPNYPNNRPNKFRVRLPKPLHFNGNWVCGLHSISFAYSWPSTIGTLDEQFISIHFKHKDKNRIIRVPIPRASHTKVDDLRDSLARAFKLQLEAIKAINSGTYLKKSKLLNSPSERRQKRAASVPAPPPPPAKTPKKDENKSSAAPAIPKLPSSATSRSKSPPSLPPPGKTPKKDEDKSSAAPVTQNLPSSATNRPKSPPPPPPPPSKTPKKDENKASAAPVAQASRSKSPSKSDTISKGRIERNSDNSGTNTTIPLPSILVEPFPAEHKQTPQTSTTIVLPSISVEPFPEGNTQTAPLPITPTKPVSIEQEKQQHSQTAIKTHANASAKSAISEKTKDENKTENKSIANENSEVNSKAEEYLSGLLGADRYDLDYLDLDLFQEIIGGVELQYEKGYERFKAVFKDKRIEHISFTLQLGYVLGFANPRRVDNYEIAKYGCDLRGGFSNFGVYAKGLTENMIIGNSLSSLLRVVSVTGATPGEYQEKIYDTPIYARVLPREISEIQIELRTLDDGRLVPFAYGTVLAVLIFKRVIDF